MDVYLIQRGNFRKSDRKRGVDNLLSFQYMGSSEFEFGAMGESLKRIRRELHNYTYETVVFNGRPITVFAQTTQIAAVYSVLGELARGTKRLKERGDFDTYIYPNDHRWASETDFWWCLDSDFMFWRANAEFMVEFLAAMGV